MALHAPLKTEDSIRLLRVRRDHHGRIVGELESFVLGSKHTPSYKTISYVWGRRTAQKGILVNGIEVFVLPSVYCILEALCDNTELFFQRHYKAGSGWIWLDSICINQKDVVELSKQVAYMADIFGKSRSTIVWLGPGTEQTDRGMELMRLLATCEENRPISHPMLKDISAWRAYQEIALNPWWRRAWTLQESLVPQEIIYYCGSKCLTEREVRRSILVTNEGLIPKDSSLDSQSWVAMWNRRRITQWYWGGETAPPGESISLPALLAYTRHAQASDESDYIYSLVGCVNAMDQRVVGETNYILDVDSIYIAFARKWILRHESLDIICFTTLFNCESSGTESDLPSWVPDWRNRCPAEWIASNPVPLLVSQPANHHIGSLMPRKYVLAPGKAALFTASGDRTSYSHFSSDMRLLTCRGITLDVIDGLGGMVDSPSEGHTLVCEPLVQSSSPLDCPSACLESGVPPDTSPAAVRKDIALSLVLGRADIYLQHWADARRVNAQIITILRDAKSGNGDKRKRTRELLAWFRYNRSLLIRGVTLEEAFAQQGQERLPELRHTDFDPEDASEHSISTKFKKACTLRDMARRIIATENGHVGMVPQIAQRGDLVCILYGCSVPVVLREAASGRYQFVGECYLQGFMEGQAVEGGRYSTSEYVLE